MNFISVIFQLKSVFTGTEKMRRCFNHRKLLLSNNELNHTSELLVIDTERTPSLKGTV